MIWRKVCELSLGGYRAEFLTLYEDAREGMSDCVRPQYDVSPRQKNRCVRIVDSRGISIFHRECDREEGNRLYAELVKSGDVSCLVKGA